MSEKILGISIGGTKSAASLGETFGDDVRVLDKAVVATSGKTPARVLDELSAFVESKGFVPDVVGVICGGPLDERAGLVLSPPNLPGWDRVDVVGYFTKRFGVRARLLNDANAGALAEWRFGAGKGKRNVVFLTFGTGLGAGLVLDGRLYSGSSGNAGEIGHVRLAKGGNVGYGKAGSCEGFVSGAGMAQTGKRMALAALERGKATALASTPADAANITAKLIAEKAAEGDAVAESVMRYTGRKLGRMLAILVDLFDPDAIVIGGVYARNERKLKDYAMPILRREALPAALATCEILPAALGEKIDEYAAFSAALYAD